MCRLSFLAKRAVREACVAARNFAYAFACRKHFSGGTKSRIGMLLSVASRVINYMC